MDTVTPSGASLLSSPRKSPIVNDNPPPRPMSLRRFLRLERRIRTAIAPPETEPPRQPRQAEAVLAALARAFPPGTTICREQVCEVAGVSMPVAGAVRVWAKANGLWPYRDSKGGFARRRKGGEA